MSRQYFGTDGVRGRVGEPPMTAEFALRLGRAAGVVLGGASARPKVLIGKDTRVSGYMLESALEAGLSAAGADVCLLGPLPTPAVAFLTRSQRAQAGIVISASHNPFEDNGIKFFSAEGEKLDDALEAAIEAELERPFTSVAPMALGKATRLADAQGRYLEFLKSRLSSNLAPVRGLRLVVDAAHGAAYRVAPRLFEELGFQVHAIGVEPNGFNINDRCGATDLSSLRAEVQRLGADLGIAVDGDADRLMLVSGNGRSIDGDDVLYLLACHRRRRGQDPGPVVGTVMTNLGIEKALGMAGLRFERAAVGDRYVHQRLKECGGVLGGEASGHLLALDLASTGDGLLSALLALEVLADTGQDLERLLAGVHRYPQRTINVRVQGAAKAVLATAAVAAARRDAEARLGERGRVILRASGTEPLLRVTVEAEDAALLEQALTPLAAAVQAAAGSAHHS